MVFQVDEGHVKPRYRHLMVRRTTNHPRQNVDTGFVLKFQITSCYFKTVMERDSKDIFQYWWDFNFLRRHNNNTCPLPGDGQCHRTCSTGNVSVNCNACISSTVSSGYRWQCFFVRQDRVVDGLGQIGQLCLGNTALFYEPGNAPVVFYISGMFATSTGYGMPLENQTLHLANLWDSMNDQQYRNAAILLDTYPWYSNN